MCILTLCVSLLLDMEQEHARIALQVNTAGTFHPLLLVLRLLISSYVDLVYVVFVLVWCYLCLCSFLLNTLVCEQVLCIIVEQATNPLLLCLIYVYDWIQLSLLYLHIRLYVCVYLDSLCIIIYSATGAGTCTDCVAGKYSRYVSSISTCIYTTPTHMLIL